MTDKTPDMRCPERSDASKAAELEIGSAPFSGVERGRVAVSPLVTAPVPAKALPAKAPVSQS